MLAETDESATNLTARSGHTFLKTNFVLDFLLNPPLSLSLLSLSLPLSLSLLLTRVSLSYKQEEEANCLIQRTSKQACKQASIFTCWLYRVNCRSVRETYQVLWHFCPKCLQSFPQHIHDFIRQWRLASRPGGFAIRPDNNLLERRRSKYPAHWASTNWYVGRQAGFFLRAIKN